MLTAEARKEPWQKCHLRDPLCYIAKIKHKEMAQIAAWIR